MLWKPLEKEHNIKDVIENVVQIGDLDVKSVPEDITLSMAKRDNPSGYIEF